MEKEIIRNQETETRTENKTFHENVLYQRIFNQVFAFTIIQGEIYYGKIEDQETEIRA